MRDALLTRHSVGLGILTAAFAMTFASACTHGAATDGPGTSGASAPAPGAADPSAPLARSQSRAKGIVIATIQTHDRRVAILGRMVQVANGTTDPESLRVVVHTNDGALLADGVPIAELERIDPSIYRLVTSAVASGDQGSYIDATLHVSRAERSSRPGQLGVPR